MVDALAGVRTLAGVRGTADHVLRNRVAWDRLAADYAVPGLDNWAASEPAWGIWKVPEVQLGVLPPRLDRAGILELGCGTGYVCAWLARRGARPVGVDNSAAQLATAAALQDRFRLRFPLIQASAEQAPFTASTYHCAIISISLSRCSAARSWFSAGSSATWYNSQ